MHPKSIFTPIVVIGFLIFSMSMAASVNIHAGGPQSTQCKNLMATYRRIDDLLSINKELRGMDSNTRANSHNIAKEAASMKATLKRVRRGVCDEPKKPGGKPKKPGGKSGSDPLAPGCLDPGEGFEPICDLTGG
jgi:hypothetical protein